MVFFTIGRKAVKHVKQADKLKRNEDFKKVYARGKSVVTPYLVLYFLRNGLPDNRLGISVSKKVGNSVVRNRVKRLIREAFRLSPLTLRTGLDLVVIARVRMNQADYATVEKHMGQVLGKIRKDKP